MPRKPVLLTDEQIDGCHLTTEKVLTQVATIQEVAALWPKSVTALKNAIMTGKIEARRSLTGGSTLVFVPDVVRLYGQPKHTTLSDIYIGGITWNSPLE